MRVGAFDFLIIDWDSPSANAERSFGVCIPGNQTIKVDSSVHPMKVADTLIHEINHAIWWAYNMYDEDKQERTVATMATAWTQIYRDNPEILAFIQQQVASLG